MLIDYDDDIAESKKLDAEPFNIMYQTHQRGEPTLVLRDDADNPALTYSNTLKDCGHKEDVHDNIYCCKH